MLLLTQLALLSQKETTELTGLETSSCGKMIKNPCLNWLLLSLPRMLAAEGLIDEDDIYKFIASCLLVERSVSVKSFSLEQVTN